MPSQLKRKLIRYKWLVKPTLMVGIFFIAAYVSLVVLFPMYRFLFQEHISTNFFGSLLFNTPPPIRSYQSRTNIAILGMMGGGFDGFDLTDTIMLLSLDYQKKDMVLVSIPRDIWLDSIKDKINAAYHYGELKKKRSGILMAKSAIEEVVGQPLHYAIAIDSLQLGRMIDLVGGVDIEVERAFTDNYFPIPGREDDFCGGDPTFSCRFEKLHFEAGREHMDGERALKYMRSRQAEGEEGTDFARSKRQQKVIVALKDKLKQLSLWKNPSLIKDILIAANSLAQTDMNWSEKILLAKFFFTLPDGNIRKAALDVGAAEKNVPGYLINPPPWQYNGAWVLIPRTKDFKEIQEFISCQIENPRCSLHP